MDEQQVFLEAIEIADPPRRREFIVQACGGNREYLQQVERLIAAHDREHGILEEPPRGITNDPEQFVGGSIDQYKLLEKIGEGGFGIVYMAEQREPVIRRVAVKVIKAGMDSKQIIARFEAERQALALMDHPNIAKVFDGGTTEKGRPYFVMELVNGIPVTQFCDDARLTVRARLRLFVTICRAVHHAHQKGIIHRDLKPTNVLVAVHDGQPVPVVIDFGIAKATGGQLTENTVFTGFQHFMGSPQYVSPEQTTFSGSNIDTRADIYSLGAVLYQLLTGTTPLEKTHFEQATWDEVCRIIREIEPQAPSQRLSFLGERLELESLQRGTQVKRLLKMIRGELDWITSKALEKDRSRRYDSAAALAEDIERYLNCETVMARPVNWQYRLGKLVRRNRGVAAALMAIAAALLVGTLFSTIGFVSANQARRIANDELVRNRQLMYVSDVNRAQNELEAGNTQLAIELLDRHRPTKSNETDLRTFPWYYLWRKCHQCELVVDHGTPVHPVRKWTSCGRLRPARTEGWRRSLARFSIRTWFWLI